MSLVAIARPSTESEAILLCCLLRAHEIPCFVRGGGMAGLFPGLQIDGYNTRTVLVPVSAAAEAVERLREAKDGDATAPATSVPVIPAGSAFDTLRLVLETLLFGWFVPRSGPARTQSADVD